MIEDIHIVILWKYTSNLLLKFSLRFKQIYLRMPWGKAYGGPHFEVLNFLSPTLQNGSVLEKKKNFSPLGWVKVVPEDLNNTSKVSWKSIKFLVICYINFPLFGSQ